MNKLIIFIFLLGLSACSTTLKVEHIANDKNGLNAALKKNGVFFTLPKTQLKLSSTLRKKEKTLSRWSLTYTDNSPKNPHTTHDFEKMNELCTSKTDAILRATDHGVNPPVKSFVYISKPTLESLAVPDLDHIYFIDVSFDRFARFTHTVSLSNTGIISSANSKVGNSSIASAKFGLDLATSVLGIDSKGGAIRTDFDSDSVGQANKKICKNIIAANKKLTNGVAKLKQAKQDIKDDKITFANKVLATPSSYQDFDIELIKYSLAAKEEKYKEDLKNHKNSTKYVEAFGKSKSTYFAYDAVYQPKLDDTVDQISAKLLGTSVGAEDPTASDALGVSKIKLASGTTIEDHLKGSKVFSFAISKKGIAAVICPHGSACDPNLNKVRKGGYRYRIPGLASVTLFVNGTKLFDNELPIAQYGPLALLPNRIKGLEGNIAPTYYDDMGSLKTVTLGATPATGESIMANLDAVNRIRRGLRGESEEQKTVLEKLQEENSLLEAQKKNKELKTALGL